ncbi:ABC transporter ATP-binding protein [Mycetocola reblochoni]|uniref:ATP-binding cassette domain-containing protein n=2 Tax=Mycetocola reblochoni TaxID=331618 RepID=A0A3L6ZJT4_9MICO|nr:ATP-binding cassette domain-containing protein [Mycetocola reblochoni]RLP68254.1 ATP-binding cassette domain-containing protein [Mycetocola reblochoni]SJN31276.1 putative ABC transporter ATP-binding protein [Mycetocola reblochoni REB411]
MIDVQDVVKSYGGRRVVDRVSFRAEDGLVTGFVGPNGAGKSTVLRMAAQITRADEGRVLVDGEPFGQAPLPARRLGIFLSAETLPDRMTGIGFLRYAARSQGVPVARAAELIGLVGLEGAESKRIASYSLGMRQRLGIAVAMLCEPSNLVLDEPINGLDPDAIRWLRGFVTGVARAGNAVLLSSHHMAELGLVADRVVMLDRGRVVRTGSLDEFVTVGQRRCYIEALDLDAAVAALRAEGVRAEPSRQGVLAFDIEPERAGAIVYRAGGTLRHLSSETPSLEDSYFASLGAAEATGEQR